jgi:quinol monooxygenase YgiN
MTLGRREFVTASIGAGAYALFAPAGAVLAGGNMYGLIGKMTAAAGRREELIKILLDGVANMPGCISYIVAKDVKDADGIWITEVWYSKDSHAASLKLPQVKDAIAKGRPLIKNFDVYHETEPVGGHGLSKK